MLIDGTVDAVIADGAILFEYNRRLGSAGVLADMEFAPVFCATPYRMVFRKAQARAAFDEGMAKLRASGALERIEERFIAEHRLVDTGYNNRSCLP